MSSALYQPSSVRGRGALVIMANAKKSLGCTKEGTRRWGLYARSWNTQLEQPSPAVQQQARTQQPAGKQQAVQHAALCARDTASCVMKCPACSGPTEKCALALSSRSPGCPPAGIRLLHSLAGQGHVLGGRGML
jgi:hypothetical protein